MKADDLLPLHGQLSEELDSVLWGDDDAHPNLREVVLCFRTTRFSFVVVDCAQAIVEARMPLARIAGCLSVTVAVDDVHYKKLSGAYFDNCRKFSNLASRRFIA